MMALLRTSTAPMAVAQLRVLGAAMARVPVEATPFAHRSRRIMIAAGAVYEDAADTPVHMAWVSSFADVVRQGEPGVHVNFLGDESEARVGGLPGTHVGPAREDLRPDQPVPPEPQHPTGTERRCAVARRAVPATDRTC